MNPGPRDAVSRLKSANFVVALQCQCHFIEALQQAITPAWIDFESVRLAHRRSNRLSLEIDADPSRALRELNLRGQAIDNLLDDDNGKNSVLKAIGKKDIAETRADNGAE